MVNNVVICIDYLPTMKISYEVRSDKRDCQELWKVIKWLFEDLNRKSLIMYIESLVEYLNILPGKYFWLQ